MPDPQEPATLPWWQRLLQTPVTAALIALCVLAYAATLSAALATSADPATTAIHSLWSLSGHEEVFRRFGALELTRIWQDDEWWRLLSTGILHGSLLHLVLNVWSLAAIGEYVEDTWGPARTLLLFIASSLAGCLASLLWCESPMVVGASAGALGQAGALWSARHFGTPTTQTKLEEVSDFRLGILILLCLVVGAVVPGIAQAGHVGGLIMGAGIGWVWSRPRPRWLHILAALVGVGALATLASLAKAPTWFPNYHLFQGARAAEEQRYPEAIEFFHIAVERGPDDASTLNDIAYALAKAKQELDWAETLARKALTADPENENFLDTLGWVLCRQGRPDEGLPLIQQSIATFSGTAPEEISQHLIDCPAASSAP